MSDSGQLVMGFPVVDPHVGSRQGIYVVLTGECLGCGQGAFTDDELIRLNQAGDPNAQSLLDKLAGAGQTMDLSCARCVERILLVSPDNANSGVGVKGKLFEQIGICYEKAERPERSAAAHKNAAEDYTKANNHNAAAEAYTKAAEAYTSANNPKAAAAAYTQAAEAYAKGDMHEAAGDAHMKAAEAYTSANNPKAAAATYTQAAEAYARGDMHEAAGDAHMKAARAHYLGARAMKSEKNNARRAAAKAYLEAAENYEKKNNDKAAGDVYMKAGSAWLGAEYHLVAVSAFTKAAEAYLRVNDHNAPKAYEAMAQAYANRGNVGEMLKDESAAGDYAKAAQAYKTAAEAYAKTGNPGEADSASGKAKYYVNLSTSYKDANSHGTSSRTEVIAYTQYLKILGLPATATAEETKKKYYALSKEMHPDKNPDQYRATADAYKAITSAYGELDKLGFFAK